LAFGVGKCGVVVDDLLDELEVGVVRKHYPVLFQRKSSVVELYRM